MSYIINPMMMLFLIFQVLVIQSGWASQGQREFVFINSGPNDAVCIATKSAISNTRKDQAGSLYGLLRNQQVKAPYSLVVEEINFHAFNTGSFSVVQNKTLKQMISSYYTLDINNSGVVRTVELVAGGYKGASEGGGDTLWVYKNSWADAPQPIDHGLLANVVLEVGYRKFTFYKAGLDFSFKYYIYPFRYKDKNFLLIESNVGSPRSYVVVEVAADFKISTRCSF